MPSDLKQKPAWGCEIAPPVPIGTVLKDTRLKTWTVGKPIGAGGFGAIYLCDRGDNGEISNDSEFVVKIEPHSNGPLFVEMHVFLRIGLEEHMAGWQPRQTDKPHGWVGIPKFHGAGSIVVADTKLRFVVMTRFASDIEKFFKSGSKPLPLATVLNIAVQVINSLEYLHSKHYTHNDVKAQNLLLDAGGCDVFLVDFGLACKFKDNYGFHCDGGGDERKAHEGTLEYTSRDAHIGAHSRRGDLETLGYNLVHWASGFLPWMETEDHEYVQAQKNGFLENVETFMIKCFKPEPYPDVLKEYFEYICQLEFKTRPDYKHLRKMLGKALDELGSKPHTKLEFGKKTKIRKSRKSDIFPILMNEEEGRATRSQDDGKKVFWQDILDPESIMKSASRSNFDEDSSGLDPVQEAAEQERQQASLLNPTPEMCKIIEAKKKLEEERMKLGWKEQLAEYNKRNAANKLRFATMDLTPCYNTPVMDEVIARRAARLAEGHHTPDPSDDEMEDECNTTVIERNNVEEASESFPNDQLQEELTPLPSNGTTRTPIDRILRSRTNTPKKASSAPATPIEVNKELLSKSEGSTSSSKISHHDVFDTPKIKSRSKRAAIVEKASELTPAIATRTRNRTKTVSLSEVPSSLPTPAGTAPSSPTPTTPGQKHLKCTICPKTLSDKSIARHYKSVHSMKRPMGTPSRNSGLTPKLKRGRISPNECSVSDSPAPLLRHQTPRIGQELEVLQNRRRAAIDQELNPPDSPSKNIRVAACPVCGIEMAKSLIPKHFQDSHSPTTTRRTRKKVDVVTGALARVSVSTATPEKIRNFDSPSRPDISKETVGNIVSTFRRATRSSGVDILYEL